MRKMRAVLVVVAALSLVFSACGSDDKSDSGDAATKRTPAAGLPQKIKDAGELVIGSDIEYPPNEFYAEGTETARGLDIDLGKAIAKELGVKAKFVNDTDFKGIIGAMNAGRFDIVMSSMTDTKERQGQGATFVDYFTAGTSLLVKKGNPKQITSVDDLCGNSVAVQTGTTQDLEILTPQVEKCQSAGKPLNVLRFDKDSDALQQVKLGRAVANLEDSPVAAYNAKTSGSGKDFEVTGEAIGSAPYGIAIPTSNTALVPLVQKALQTLMDNGTYGRILTKWGQAAGALKTAQLNGGS